LENFKGAKFANIAVIKIRKDDSRNCVMKVFGLECSRAKVGTVAVLCCGG